MFAWSEGRPGLGHVESSGGGLVAAPCGGPALPLCGEASRPSSHPRGQVAAPQNLAVVNPTPPHPAYVTPGSRPASSKPLLRWDQSVTKLSKNCRLRGRAEPGALGEILQQITPRARPLPASQVLQGPTPFQAGGCGAGWESGLPGLWASALAKEDTLKTSLQTPLLPWPSSSRGLGVWGPVPLPPPPPHTGEVKSQPTLTSRTPRAGCSPSQLSQGQIKKLRPG